MKIIDVAEFYSENGGGTRTYLRQKLAAGRRAGHDIMIVAPGAEDREENVDGGRIRWVKSPREFLDHRYHRFADPAAIHAILDHEAPDVVEASSPWKGGRIVAQWHGHAVRVLVMHTDPVAVYPHTFFDNIVTPERVDRICARFWSYLNKLRANFDTCIVPGLWLAQRFARFNVGPCIAVPFGIEKDQFSPALRDPNLRRRMLAACGIDDDSAPLFITVSRHHPEKRLGVIADAMARIGHRRPAGLFLVGDGPLRGWVERITAQVPGIVVAGQVERGLLTRYLASADALLHAGAAETFGLAIAEGICSGLPIVVPDRGGAADLAAPEFAETYAAGNAEACAAAAERMMSRGRVALSRAAVGAARRLLTPDQHFARLFDHYDHLRALRQPEPTAVAA